MQPLLDITGEYATVTQTASFNEDALNQALFDTVDAAGGSAFQLALLASITGDYSDEAIQAALKSALMTQKINELAAAAVSGEKTIEEVHAEMLGFARDLETNVIPATEKQAEKFITMGFTTREGTADVVLLREELGLFEDGGPYIAEVKLDADKALEDIKELFGFLTELDLMQIGVSVSGDIPTGDVIVTQQGTTTTPPPGEAPPPPTPPAPPPPGPGGGGDQEFAPSGQPPDKVQPVTIVANTREAMALALATVNVGRRRRLEEFMGV